MLTPIKKAFLKALYPDKCLSCGQFFHIDNQMEPVLSARDYFQTTPIQSIYSKEMADFLCPLCIGEFTSITPPFCIQCGKEFKSTSAENHLCGDCIQKGKPYDRIRSAGVLNGSLMEAIHQLKYAGKIQVARPLGRVLFAAFLNYFHDVKIDLIMPVPLHASKLKSRGFNQVLVMLAEWPYLAAKVQFSSLMIDFQGRIIHRKKKTKSQTGLGREKRKDNVKGAFELLKPESIKDQHVLIIDDVYTTGATTEECAKNLMTRGSGAVHILTLARAK